MTVGAIVAQLRLDMTNFREGLAKANSLLEQHADQAGRAATMLGGIAAAATGSATVAVKMASEMESALTSMNKVLKLSEADLEAVTEQLHALARATGIEDEVLSQALANIAKAGVTGADGMKVLETATRAAVAGGAEMATVADSLVSILRAYNLSASDSGKVTDTLYQASLKGRMTFQELMSAIKGVVPIASQLGVGYDQLAAALATMTTVGYDAENSLMGLNMVMVKLTNPSAQLKKALQDAGYESGQALIQAKGLAGAIEFITKAAGDDEQAMIQMAGGARAYKAVAALAANGGALFAQKLQELTGAAGSVNQAFAQTEQTFRMQWSQFIVTTKQVGEEVGNLLLPALTLLVRVLRSVGTAVKAAAEAAPMLRALVVAAAATGAALAGATAAFIVYNTQIKASLPAMLGLVSATRQTLGALAMTQVQVSAMAPNFARVTTAAKGLWATLQAPAPATLGYGAIIVAIYAFTAAVMKATDESNRLNDQLMELYQRAEKVGAALPAAALNDLRPSQAQFFFSSLRESFGLEAIDQVKMWREQVAMAAGEVEQAERRQRLAAEQTAEVKKRLEETNRTALQNRLADIERERQARIKAGVDEQLANELAEQERVAARQQANAEMLKLEAQLLEAEGKTHEARVKAIIAEAEEWRQQNEQKLGKEKAADAAEQLKRAKLIELSRQEAQERAKAFEEAAGKIVTDWTNAVETMRQADQLSTSEYLSQLSKVLDLIRQMNVARAAAGQGRLFEQEELRLAQTIFSERKRMQQEIEAGEKRLADARKQWAQEELAERKRLNDYELSLIDLTFQHRRDLARIAGDEDERTSAQIAQEELAALQQRRAEEQLNAQERLDSLERERQLILEIAQAGLVPQGDATKALGAVFEAMKEARDEIAAQEKAAFEERRQQHEESMKQLQTEQKTLRDQLSETGGRITQVAQSVFDLLERRIKALGTIRLEPAMAGALPGPGGGGRVVNLYFNGQRVGGSADIGRIADQLAEMLEREVTYNRG